MAIRIIEQIGRAGIPEQIRQPSEQYMKRALPLLSFAIFAIVMLSMFMARIVRDDRAAQEAIANEPSITGKRGKVIAKIHSTGDSGTVSLVYAVEKKHRFPNGTIAEGWLVEPQHLQGQGGPIWIVPPKGRIEWLVPYARFADR
jgi:hypothetical protein